MKLKYQCLVASVSLFCLFVWKLVCVYRGDNFDDSTAYKVSVFWFRFLENATCGDCVQLLVCLTACGLLFDVYRQNPADSHCYNSLWKQYFIMKIYDTFAEITRWRFERCTRNVKTTQEDLLIEILEGAEGTAYGRDYSFSKIKTVEDFRRVHPLSEYAQFKHYIDRSVLGEKGMLFADKVVYFMATTGTTTGKSKLYPINKKRFFKGAFRNALSYWHEIRTLPGNHSLNRGIHIHMASTLNHTDLGVPVGPGSALTERRFYPGNSTPKSGMRIIQMQSALYVHVLFGLKLNDISWLYANFSSHILSFFRLMEEHWDEICFDIQTGKVSKAIDLPEEIRSSLSRHLTPDRARAIELRRIFHNGFQNIAHRIWPTFSYVFCIATGPFQSYTDILREKYIGDSIVFSPIHIASEGIFGVNVTPLSKITSYVICPAVTFYEFLPIEDMELTNPRTFLAHEVTIGKEYEIVATTLLGLYRYRTSDVVRIVGHYNQAPMYEFIQRRGDNLDLFGEKTTGAMVESAVRQAFSNWHHLTLSDYTCTESVHLQRNLGIHSNRMYYVLFIEVHDDITLTEENAAELDAILCEGQEEYEVDREAGRISQLKIIQVKNGTFEQFKCLLVSSNRNSSFAQLKIPKVTRRDEHIRLLVDSVTRQKIDA